MELFQNAVKNANGDLCLYLQIEGQHNVFFTLLYIALDICQQRKMQTRLFTMNVFIFTQEISNDMFPLVGPNMKMPTVVPSAFFFKDFLQLHNNRASSMFTKMKQVLLLYVLSSSVSRHSV